MVPARSRCGISKQERTEMSENGKEALASKICHHVEDLATISSEGLMGEEKDQFVLRTQELMNELTTMALN